jgi:hypothetical protein
VLDPWGGINGEHAAAEGTWLRVRANLGTCPAGVAGWPAMCEPRYLQQRPVQQAVDSPSLGAGLGELGKLFAFRSRAGQ